MINLAAFLHLPCIPCSAFRSKHVHWRPCIEVILQLPIRISLPRKHVVVTVFFARCSPTHSCVPYDAALYWSCATPPK